MKAMVVNRRGEKSILEFRPEPQPGPREAVLKVRAAGVAAAAGQRGAAVKSGVAYGSFNNVIGMWKFAGLCDAANECKKALLASAVSRARSSGPLACAKEQ